MEYDGLGPMSLGKPQSLWRSTRRPHISITDILRWADAFDTLTGGVGMDWFFLNKKQDILIDWVPGERQN